MDFPPGILHHLVRVARYVYSCAFIRTSRALVSRYFVREGRSYDHGKPVYSFFLSLRDRPLILIMGIGDFAERQVRCFIFVQSKVAFLSSWHKFRLSPTFFFPRQRRITEGRERGNVATRCLMLAIYVCRSLPSRVEFVTSWRQLFTLSFPLAS